MGRPESYKGMRCFQTVADVWGTITIFDASNVEVEYDEGGCCGFYPEYLETNFLLPGEPDCPVDPNPPRKAEDIQVGDRFWVRKKTSKWKIFSCDIRGTKQWIIRGDTSWSCDPDFLAEHAIYIPDESVAVKTQESQEMCPSCNTQGKVYGLCCKCPDCGHIIWGV